MTGPADQDSTEHVEHVEDAQAHSEEALEGHAGRDAYGHLIDEHHHGHEDLPAESPGWVVPPLVVGLVIGIILLLVFGVASGAAPFNAL